jgi:putative YphP/YqiW family bacilliredoxin
MYDPQMTQPMRDELTRIGVTELRTPAEVEAFLAGPTGTALVIVNSVCGCAAGMARPGLKMALSGEIKPDRVGSVFAGVDREATARARAFFDQLSASSPSFALFKDGKCVHFVPRHQIEGRDAASLAAELSAAFARHCAPVTV